MITLMFFSTISQ